MHASFNDDVDDWMNVSSMIHDSILDGCVFNGDDWIVG